MALINVIPAVSIYAVAVPGAPGKPAEVRLYDGNGDRLRGDGHSVSRIRRHRQCRDGRRRRRRRVRPHRRRRQGPRAGSRCVYSGKAESGQGASSPSSRASSHSRRGARRRQRGRRADRRDDRRQHHRGFGSRHPERGEGLSIRAAVTRRMSRRRFLDLQALRRRSQRREHCHRLRRFFDRPRQHRHRARPGQPGRGEGVRLPAAEAHRRRLRRGSGNRSNRPLPPRSFRSATTIAAAFRWRRAGSQARSAAPSGSSSASSPATVQLRSSRAARHWTAGRRCTCKAPCTTITAPNSARSRLQALRRVSRYARCHHQHD